jgi:biopolymer transport protein TolR
VTLRADRQLDYGRVMAVMGELNRAGFTAIALVTTGSVPSP